MGNKLSQSDIDRVIEMAWEDRTTFADIRKQFGIQEKEVIKLMKENMKRSSFLMWRKRVRGRKTKISCLLYTSPSPRDLRASRMPSSA